MAPEAPLYVPHPKRLVCVYDATSDGGRELRINYGVKEVLFDEERFFAFGEQLVQQRAFTGEEATRWGAGYEWDELAPMLEALLADGVLRRGQPSEEPPDRVPSTPRLVPPRV